MEKDLIHTKDYLEYVKVDRYAAYGNFLDRFRECNNKGRQRLIAERPEAHPDYHVDLAILAATVEVLVKEYGLSMPKWVSDPIYIQEEPYYGGAENPDYQMFLEKTALPEFAKRNLFLGDNCMNRA